jgi:hypothetical protein
VVPRAQAPPLARETLLTRLSHSLPGRAARPGVLRAVLLTAALATAGCGASSSSTGSGTSQNISQNSAFRQCLERRGAVHALRGVNVVIGDGDWLAIQGPTGHGKSTLLQILGALDRPTSGTVELDGQDLTGLRESQLTKVCATSIGFIFQTFNLIPTFVRPGERRGRVGPARRGCRAAEGARHAGASRGRAEGPDLASALRTLRRLAAAGSDRAGPGQETGSSPRRRAHRQPRRRHLRRDHDALGRPVARTRPHARDRHTRLLGGTQGPADRHHAQRPAHHPGFRPRPAHEGITVVRRRGHAGPVARARHGRGSKRDVSCGLRHRRSARPRKDAEPPVAHHRNQPPCCSLSARCSFTRTMLRQV